MTSGNLRSSSHAHLGIGRVQVDKESTDVRKEVEVHVVKTREILVCKVRNASERNPGVYLKGNRNAASVQSFQLLKHMTNFFPARKAVSLITLPPGCADHMFLPV